MARARFTLAALLAVGCGVQERSESTARVVPFACDSDADCPTGSCLAEFGICTQESRGRLASLLFEVKPQASDPVYGGASYLTIQDVTRAPAAGQRLELNVRPRVPVTGRVTAAPELASCLTVAQSTLPVTLTFTPRETLLGLSLPSYELKTGFDSVTAVREWIFQGSLPPGSYDVYMRPDFTYLGEDCRAIPQLFRNRSIGNEAAQLDLQQPTPSALRLTIAWSERLEGWRLDMIHPVTGEVLSNRVTLRASNVDAVTNTLQTTLDYSRADPDFLRGADELLRLAPPEQVPAGTVLLARSGVEALSPGQGEIGNVSSFGVPVDYQAWVWKEGLDDTPVPATVTFSALELDEVEAGVPAAFEASARVDSTGQVNARLLPGRYRVRVMPPGMELGELGAISGYESTLTVWPNGLPELDRQGGHVIAVPPASSLGGRVFAEPGGAPLRRVEVRASASNPERVLCPPAAPGQPEPACEPPRAPVLQLARAQDPFIARTRVGLTDGDGNFAIHGLDCGPCEAERPVLFDVTVRPEVTTGLPWVLRTGVDPRADEDGVAEPLRVPMPVARPMRVTYGSVASDAGPGAADPSEGEFVTQPLSGALVRVFAFLDNRGRLVESPGALVTCVSLPTSPNETCLQSLLQVAEGRTDGEGDFLLLLPPDLE